MTALESLDPVKRTVTSLVGLVMAAFLLAGCVSRQPVEASGRSQLPDDWYRVSESDWRYRALPESVQYSLRAVKDRMMVERGSRGYAFYGQYSDATLSRMSEVSELADQALLTSVRVIMRDLTPELKTIGSTHDDFTRDRVVSRNQDLRMLVDDWNRLWLLDGPSTLAPNPIVDTTGNP